MASIVGQALLNGDLFCQYQPVVTIEGQNIFYYETLVRKQNKGGEVVGPLDFLYTIENKKFEAFLTQEVFWQACKEFSNNQERFAINIPPKAMMERSTFMMIESMIRNSNMGERIVFEVRGSDWLDHTDILGPSITQ